LAKMAGRLNVKDVLKDKDAKDIKINEENA
jgi:hypothetical protein